MLNFVNLGQELWVESISTTCYLINWSPSIAIDCKISEEVWTSHPYDYTNLKIFGCEAYALTPKIKCSKLDPRSKKCIFVGYDDVTKGYRLWDPTARKIVISRDVIFDESSLIKSESIRVDVE